MGQSPKTPVFGVPERRAANDSQVRTFFRGYESRWRLSKLLLIKELLKQRAQLPTELGSSLPPAYCDEAFVYGPMTNGLILSAVAELVMLAEDMFALLKYVRSRERFARSLVHYDAGSVTNLAPELAKAPPARLLSAFMVPTLETIERPLLTDQLETYRKGTASLVRLVRRASDTYARYATLYGQYKHGLTVALKPFGGNPPPKKTLERRKQGLTGVLQSYATMRPRKGSSVLSFMLEPETKPFLAQLFAEDNLLRFEGEPRETDLEPLIESAFELTHLVELLAFNRMDLTNHGAPSNKFAFPGPDPGHSTAVNVMEVPRASGRWTLDAFAEKL